MRGDRQGPGADGLGDPGHHALAGGGGGLGRPVARPQSGAAAREHQVGRLGAVGQLAEQGLEAPWVVGDHLAADDLVAGGGHGLGQDRPGSVLALAARRAVRDRDHGHPQAYGVPFTFSIKRNPSTTKSGSMPFTRS